VPAKSRCPLFRPLVLLDDTVPMAGVDLGEHFRAQVGQYN
jgi:hypothetical protein